MNMVELFGNMLSLVAIALFFWACGVGLVRFVKQESGQLGETLCITNEEKLSYKVGGLCFAICSLGVAFFCVVALVRSPGASLETALQNLYNIGTDARHYRRLAEFGYGLEGEFIDQDKMIVFFPLYPTFIAWVHLFTGLGFATVAIFMQPFFFALAGAATFALVQRHFGAQNAWWALAFLLCLPTSFYFAAPMTESLFLALSMLAFWAIERQKPGQFALFAALATLARPTGGLLAGVAGILFLQSLRAKKPKFVWLAAAFAPVASFCGYLYLNYAIYGNPFQYAVILKEHWSNGFGWFFDTVQYHLGYLVSWWQSNHLFAVYVSLATVLCILLQLALLALGAKRLPLHWLGYCLAYVLVADGATWLLSGLRYNLSLPFIPLCFLVAAKNNVARAGVLVLSAAIGWTYLCVWFAGGPIY